MGVKIHTDPQVRYDWMFRVIFTNPNNAWRPLVPLLKVKLLVGPTCKIPRSTQRS